MKPPFGNVQSAHVSVELLSSYLDNQVTLEEQLRVEQHLRTCASCRAELNSLRQTVALMQALPRIRVPRAFTLSEAQVGIRRPAARPWFWGAARALGAVAAVIVVAVVAVQLLQRPNQPTAQVARAPQPASAPAPQAAPGLAAEPTAAESAVPESQSAVPDTATAPESSPTIAQKQAVPAPTSTRPTLQSTTIARSFPQVTAAAGAAARAAAPTKANTRSSQPTVTQAAPAAAAPAPAPAAPLQPAPTEPQALALAPQPTGGPVASAQAKTAPPAAAAAAAAESGPAAATAMAGSPLPTASMGRGGGPVPGGAPNQADAGRPSALPPAAPLSSALSPSTGLVYVAGSKLTTIDAQGTHSLTDVSGLTAPTISPDRSWIVYQVPHEDYNELWAMRWDGSDAHLILNTGKFPASGGGTTGPAQIAGTQWVPGGHVLALHVTVPDPANPDQPGRQELWTINAEANAPRYVLDLGTTGASFFSPNGKLVALLQRGNPAANPSQPQGLISLFNADGSNQRQVLEVPANVNGFGFDSQLAWAPDSNALWAAIPDAQAMAPQSSGLTLYRIPVRGAAEPAGKIEAIETFWSPDARHLAYVRATDPSGENRELVLANPDGSRAQVYAPITAGGDMGSWSPDSRAFTYTSGNQLYVGSLGQAPQLLGPAGTLIEPHWIGPEQMWYLLDQGDNWALVSRSGDGKTASLAQIPKDSAVAMSGR
jgi:Tol biopolymer transport system component